MEKNRGRLMVYFSRPICGSRRFRTVSAAVEKTAKDLNLDVEFITLKGKNAPIYVYYQNGNEEPVPLYCDKNQNDSAERIYGALRGMMFVLSFHPRYRTSLNMARERIMGFS
ncbi:MAG: hypothetical protein N3F10_03540 [Candidatus Bathyarchaeota archaeon]|nr:hypothetical protein [Candidatus Bathyarchaeota archaeon]MCX8177353.1 hypothetical protein [Candidatus Bathyarchaeota archaeon]MDW8193799.1 hypothetical protein [Nitrososphaerota archaeon]